MNDTHSGFMEWQDTKIYYEMKGEGEPLLLIHGLPVDSRMWDGQFDELSMHFKVIRFDLAGYGKSGVHEEDYSLLDDLKALLDHLSIKKTSILGLSVGGQIAIDFTLQYPQLVQSMILASTGVNGWSSYSKERQEFNQELNTYYQNEDKAKVLALMTKGWVAGPFREMDDVAEKVRHHFSSMVNHTFSKQRGTGRMLPSTLKTMELLNQIQTPTLLITSEYDFTEFNDIAEHIYQKVKNAERVKIAGTAHMMNMERPKEFNREVIAFLRKNNLA